MVQQVQVPDYAGTIQNAQKLHQSKQATTAASQLAQRKQMMDIYTKGREQIMVGLQKFEEYKANAPADKIKDLDRSYSFLGQSASVLDTLGKQMGIQPMLSQTVQQAFNFAPTGDQTAQLEGGRAALKNNATTAGTNFVAQGAGAAQQSLAQAQSELTGGLGKLEGRIAADQSNTELANTDTALAGNVAAKINVAERMAMVDLVSGAVGIKPGTPDYEEIKNDFLGIPVDEWPLTPLSIAAGFTGPDVLKKIEKGIALTEDELTKFESVMKRLRVSDDLVASVLAGLVASAGGGNAGGAPAAAGTGDKRSLLQQYRQQEEAAKAGKR